MFQPYYTVLRIDCDFVHFSALNDMLAAARSAL